MIGRDELAPEAPLLTAQLPGVDVGSSLSD
jgi:hypothetical protein